MATATLDIPAKNLADVLHELGDIPPERIRFPVGTATEQDLIDALDGAHKRLYELIDGVLVEKDIGFRDSVIEKTLGWYLVSYVDEHDLGIVFGADGPIRIKPGRVRLPDLGFVSWKRLPGEEVPEDAIFDGVPDLAIEVISRGNTVGEMDLKLKDYFQAGIRLVWFIYPKNAKRCGLHVAHVKESDRQRREFGGRKGPSRFFLAAQEGICNRPA